MMSMLHIARSGLLAHQRVAEVIANNIANSETPGYTRQRAMLRPIGGVQLPVTAATYGGVELFEVQRVRASFYDAIYRREVTVEAESSTRMAWLRELEAMVGGPETAPLGEAIDTFYNAWSDLANTPSVPAAKVLVQEAGRAVVEQFNRLGGQISNLRNDILQRLQDEVGMLETYSTEIGQLNVQILASSDGAPALQDRRDSLLDELSALVGARVVQQSRGDFTVVAGSSVLLDGVISPTITVGQDAAGQYILQKADGSVVQPQGGRLQGYLDLLNGDLPQFQQALDSLAQSLAEEVNALHQTGVLADGTTNIAFFDPGSTSAATLRLSELVARDAANIATGTVQSTGANDLALALAASRNATVGNLGDRSINDAFNSLVVDLGITVRVQEAAAEASGAMLENLTLQRQSESGVSPEEEMISLIQTQSAYQAMARVLTIANEMLDEILNIRR